VSKTVCVMEFDTQARTFEALLDEIELSQLPAKGECISFVENHKSIYRVIEVVHSQDEYTPTCLYVKVVDDLENEIDLEHQTLYPNKVDD